MKLKITVLGVDYEVDVEVLEDDGAATYMNGIPLVAHTIPVAQAPIIQHAAASPVPAAPVAAYAGNGIVAPVSGTIVEISCKPGDAIKRGQTIVVMDAMKMETKIASDRDGTVKSINVKAGENVREGQLLIEFA